MYNYIIATSSTADLTREYLDGHAIPFIPYSYTVGEELRTDDCREESRAAVYKGMRAGDRLKTSMINEYTYYDFFKGLLETGRNVLFLDMSVKMSVSYSNSLAAAEKLRGEFPELRLEILDTRCISGGLGLLVEEVVRRAEEGMSFDDVIAWAEENKLRIAHRFTVDDLNYLKAGGRVSNTAALVGSVLDIKPVLYVPDEGTLEVAQKVRGRKKALAHIVDAMMKAEPDPAESPILILNADAPEDAERIKAIVEQKLPGARIMIEHVGPVIGAHAGPGTVALCFIGKTTRNP